MDKPALKPLPTEPFDLSEWSRARVNIDYHVAFDANLYSVPYNLVHELVEIRSTPTTVEILHKGARVASHLRSRGRGQAVTNDEHRPKSHRAHLEWTPSRMVHWAETIGPNTARLFERINALPRDRLGAAGEQKGKMPPTGPCLHTAGQIPPAGLLHARALLHESPQNLAPVFRNPDDVVLKMAFRVRAMPVFRHPPILVELS